MKMQTFFKVFFAALAVVLLALGFSILTSKIDYGRISLPLYVSTFAGSGYVKDIFILIVSVGYESALWLIYRNSNSGKLKIFLPSIAMLVAALFVAILLFFNASWCNSISITLAVILARVCIAVIIMSCSVAVLTRGKNNRIPTEHNAFTEQSPV